MIFIILFGGLVAPILEVKLGFGGKSDGSTFSQSVQLECTVISWNSARLACVIALTHLRVVITNSGGQSRRGYIVFIVVDCVAGFAKCEELLP